MTSASASLPATPHLSTPPPAPRPLLSALAIPGQPEHVRAARAFTELVLSTHQLDGDKVAGLLVSELVSNALQHSDSGRPGGVVTVTVALTGGEVLVEVTDDGGGGYPAARPASRDDEFGRGLRLVERLADGWGYFGGKDRLSTWFQLRPGGTVPPAPPGHLCACGFAAGDPGQLTDHLLEAFTPADDRGTDGLVHDEVAPTLTCACGYAAASPDALDAHFLAVFTPVSGLASDGRRHVTCP